MIRRYLHAIRFRLSRRYEQATCNHDWMVMHHPVTLMAVRRTCRKCLKSQRAAVRWSSLPGGTWRKAE